MKARQIILCAFALLLSLPLWAENTDYTHGRHALRIGWGDASVPVNQYDFEQLHGMIFDTYGSPYGNLTNQSLLHIQGMSAPQADAYLRTYRYAKLGEMRTSGHFFLGYRYQCTPLLSIGIEGDLLYMERENNYFNGYNEHTRTQLENLYHFTLLPNLRFTYFRQSLFELYSAVGIGCSMYSYTQDIKFGLAMNATLFGVNVGNEHWFAEAELGAFQSLTFSLPAVCPLYASRLFSIAVGYRF